jgi:hypothetical protein
MADYSDRNAQRFRSSAPEHTIVMRGASDSAYQRAGALEKEDIIILVLSAILVIATIWLGTWVL